MAESNEPLLLFEGGGFDINENMPNSQNSFSNNELLINSVSSVICPESDSAFMEVTNSSETSIGCMQTLETCSEMPSNNFDVNNLDEFASNPKVDSGIHDPENNVVGGIKLIEFDGIDQHISENCGIVSDFNQEENDVEFKDEEFHDAVQFFKDPSSLVFLENAGSSSAPSEPLMARSSLYQKFDPLHAKFFSQSNELQEIAEDEVEPHQDNVERALTSDNLVSEIASDNLISDLPSHNLNSALTFDNLETPLASDNLQNEVGTDKSISDTATVLIGVESDGLQSDLSCDTVNKKDSFPDNGNKHLSQVSPRQSLGNILISFDSPLVHKEVDSLVEVKKEPEPPKIYTDEELQQALKIQELTIQENFLKKQQELETKIDQQKCLSNSLHVALKEVMDFVYHFSDKEKQLKERLEIVEKENAKLKEDLKTSVEDIQSVETTFSDFHKRYEQCKNMLKVYTENEKSLKQQIESMNMQLREKEEMYRALQSRTEEMLDKANAEVTNAKKAGDAQIAVLKAQLKKSELKISSLESDVKHVKIENGKLSSICDELMAKVSET